MSGATSSLRNPGSEEARIRRFLGSFLPGFLRASLALLALAAGCPSGGQPADGPAPLGVRRVRTHLGANARIFAHGVEVRRDAEGALSIPLREERCVVRVEEPRKVPLVEELTVLVNPPAEVEDRIYFRSTANTTVVYTGEKGSITGPRSPVALFPDPLSLVRDAEGPFLLPSRGQGVALIVSDHGSLAAIDGRPVALRPSADRAGAPSLPSLVELWPGWHDLAVEKAGLRPFRERVLVRGGQYALVFVRLAPEAAGQ